MKGNCFRSLAHLVEQIGEESFQLLIDPRNTQEVRELCGALRRREFNSKLNINKLIIGGNLYEMMPILRNGEKRVDLETVKIRAKEMGASLGSSDGEHVLNHQRDIPEDLKYMVAFIFADWHSDKDGGNNIAIVCWRNDGWSVCFGGKHAIWDEYHYVLCRK